eukprot:CAMPEP_0205917292 /NCGR_PEP_ID=MMETSP1325-20131115/9072_1 /ASSEMBLY_ACC=CAM_ASM_000708 /TAXON_ID=236786 /ORGANISM="Florenciella sp., Strain RCC1007" /LENGTH=65 /DNA_ID=CAMNT_0053284689 /DNA_START=23 /DNA_END=217 /DNA_ORIENTATION=-
MSSSLASGGRLFRSMSSGQQSGALIVTTSDPHLALQAARPGQSYRMAVENTSGRLMRRADSSGVW